MKTSDAMSVDEALNHADEWVKGQTFYPGAQGWRVVCAVLAAEVRRLRAERSEIVAKVGELDTRIMNGAYLSGPAVMLRRDEVLQILRGEEK